MPKYLQGNNSPEYPSSTENDIHQTSPSIKSSNNLLWEFSLQVSDRFIEFINELVKDMPAWILSTDNVGSAGVQDLLGNNDFFDEVDQAKDEMKKAISSEKFLKLIISLNRFFSHEKISARTYIEALRELSEAAEENKQFGLQKLLKLELYRFEKGLISGKIKIIPSLEKEIMFGVKYMPKLSKMDFYTNLQPYLQYITKEIFLGYMEETLTWLENLVEGKKLNKAQQAIYKDILWVLEQITLDAKEQEELLEAKELNEIDKQIAKDELSLLAKQSRDISLNTYLKVLYAEVEPNKSLQFNSSSKAAVNTDKYYADSPQLFDFIKSLAAALSFFQFFALVSAEENSSVAANVTLLNQSYFLGQIFANLNSQLLLDSVVAQYVLQNGQRKETTLKLQSSATKENINFNDPSTEIVKSSHRQIRQSGNIASFKQPAVINDVIIEAQENPSLASFGPYTVIAYQTKGYNGFRLIACKIVDSNLNIITPEFLVTTPPNINTQNLYPLVVVDSTTEFRIVFTYKNNPVSNIVSIGQKRYLFNSANNTVQGNPIEVLRTDTTDSFRNPQIVAANNQTIMVYTKYTASIGQYQTHVSVSDSATTSPICDTAIPFLPDIVAQAQPIVSINSGIITTCYEDVHTNTTLIDTACQTFDMNCNPISSQVIINAGSTITYHPKITELPAGRKALVFNDQNNNIILNIIDSSLASVFSVNVTPNQPTTFPDVELLANNQYLVIAYSIYSSIPEYNYDVMGRLFDIQNLTFVGNPFLFNSQNRIDVQTTNIPLLIDANILDGPSPYLANNGQQLIAVYMTPDGFYSGIEARLVYFPFAVASPSMIEVPQDVAYGFNQFSIPTGQNPTVNLTIASNDTNAGVFVLTNTPIGCSVTGNNTAIFSAICDTYTINQQIWPNLNFAQTLYRRLNYILNLIMTDAQSYYQTFSSNIPVTLTPVNHPLIVQPNLVSPQQFKVATICSYQIPAAVMTDPDGDIINFSLNLNGGFSLPEPFTFNAQTLQLQCARPLTWREQGVYRFVLSGSDGQFDATNATTSFDVSVVPSLTAENLFVTGVYQQGQPYALPSFNISTPSQENVLVLLQLAPPNSGRLTTSVITQFSSTYDNTRGLWQVASPLVYLNQFITNTNFIPKGYETVNFNGLINDTFNNPLPISISLLGSRTTNGSASLSAGAIAGIAIGSVVCIAGCLTAGFFAYRHRQKEVSNRNTRVVELVGDDRRLAHYVYEKLEAKNIDNFERGEGAQFLESMRRIENLFNGIVINIAYQDEKIALADAITKAIKEAPGILASKGLRNYLDVNLLTQNENQIFEKAKAHYQQLKAEKEQGRQVYQV